MAAAVELLNGTDSGDGFADELVKQAAHRSDVVYHPNSTDSGDGFADELVVQGARPVRPNMHRKRRRVRRIW